MQQPGYAAEDCFKRKFQDTIRQDWLKLMCREVAPAYLHEQQRAVIADPTDLRLEH